MRFDRHVIVKRILSLVYISTALGWAVGVGTAETNASSTKKLPWVPAATIFRPPPPN